MRNPLMPMAADRMPAAINAALSNSRRNGDRTALLMPEMTPPREHHRDAALIGCREPFLIPHRASRLHDRGRTRIGDRIETVAERKERVGGNDGSPERITADRLGLHPRNLCRIDAAHLARADRQRAIRCAEDDRVRLDVRTDTPREPQRLP